MKVLFLAPYVPFPAFTGGRVRAMGLIRCLARFASVQVLAAGDPRSDEAAASREQLKSIDVALEVFQPTGPGRAEADRTDVTRLPDAVAHFRCPGLVEALSRISREDPPDLVHIEELVMAQYAHLVRSPRVVDRQKVEWTVLEATARIAGEDAAGHLCEAARFRRWEASLAAEFARVLVIGGADRDILAPVYGAERIHVVPIGVDDGIRYRAGRSHEVRHVLLYGTLDYGPNVDGNAAYFRDVWPALKAALPELRTVVVGSGRPPASLPTGDPRVEFRGYVSEIEPVLGGPGVLVVPLRIGGGARTKILEALAAGMPVVSTRVGVENLGLEAGRHYLPAETAREVVDAVVRLVRDSDLAASLGREGARRVDESFRWDGIASQLEPIYRGAMAQGGSSPRPPTQRTRVLLLGARPLPEELGRKGLGFPGQRTAQFRWALTKVGCDLEVVCMDEEGPPEPARVVVSDMGRLHSLPPELFRPGREIQRVHDDFRPDLVVSAGSYHTARVAAELGTAGPRWIDLAGDLAAEGQLRAAAAGDAALRDHLFVLARALSVGDRFSAVGPSQRLALLGQVGLSGRLTGETVGEDPVAVVPLAAEGPSSVPPLPANGFRVLWSGGYNTWMDGITLLSGLERAMSECTDVVFVSTGGAIPGHDEESHGRFWASAHASRFASRFEDHGRLPRQEALDVLASCHAVVCISRRCIEAELGSRQRLVEALAHARPAIVTDQGDLPKAISQAQAGAAIPPEDPAALADAMLALARSRERLEASSGRARRLWEERWTYQATTQPLRAWVERPRRWPPSVVGEQRVSEMAAERFRLLGELEEIHASRAFRALRLLDRLLGRGGIRPPR